MEPAAFEICFSDLTKIKGNHVDVLCVLCYFVIINIYQKYIIKLY